MILAGKTNREIAEILGPVGPFESGPSKPRERGRPPGSNAWVIPPDLFDAWEAGKVSIEVVARKVHKSWPTVKRAMAREKAIRLLGFESSELRPPEPEPVPAEPERAPPPPTSLPMVTVGVPMTKIEPRWAVVGADGDPTGWFAAFGLAEAWRGLVGGEIRACRPWPGGGVEVEDDDAAPI